MHFLFFEDRMANLALIYSAPPLPSLPVILCDVISELELSASLLAGEVSELSVP